MFEDEFRSMRVSPVNVEYLMMDASLLLAPTGTPLTGIDFVKRLPCGDVERARRAIRVFFTIRDLSMTLRKEVGASMRVREYLKTFCLSAKSFSVHLCRFYCNYSKGSP